MDGKGEAPAAGRLAYATPGAEPASIAAVAPTAENRSKGRLRGVTKSEAKTLRSISRPCNYAESEKYWKSAADRCDLDQVRADLSVYRHSGSVLATDPRRESGYRKQVLEGLGIGEAKDLERWSWLSPADVEVLAEMIERKAAA